MAPDAGQVVGRQTGFLQGARDDRTRDRQRRPRTPRQAQPRPTTRPWPWPTDSSRPHGDGNSGLLGSYLAAGAPAGTDQPRPGIPC